MINVKSSKDKRAVAHNGLWGLKSLLVLVIAGLSLKIPNAFFVIIAKYFYSTGAFAFILVQIVLLVDFSFSASGFLLEKWEETYDRRYLSNSFP